MTWRSPHGPTRLGPLRSCMKPHTLRSKIVANMTASISTEKKITTFPTVARTKAPPVTAFTGLPPRP